MAWGSAIQPRCPLPQVCLALEDESLQDLAQAASAARALQNSSAYAAQWTLRATTIEGHISAARLARAILCNCMLHGAPGGRQGCPGVRAGCARAPPVAHGGVLSCFHGGVLLRRRPQAAPPRAAGAGPGVCHEDDSLHIAMALAEQIPREK